MKRFIRMLQRRFETGAWSRFSLGRLGYHVAVWAIFISFFMLYRGAESKNVTYSATAAGALLLHVALFELANHMCRSFKELALVVAVILVPGWLMANRLLLLAPSDIFPIGVILICNYQIVVTFLFLGLCLLVLAIRLPDIFVIPVPSASNQVTPKTIRSSTFQAIFRLSLHTVVWICVGGLHVALGGLKNVEYLIAFAILLEIFAWICPTFESLFALVVLLHLGVASTAFFLMFSADGSGGSPNSPYAMLWPRLLFSGWILLVWLLSLRLPIVMSSTEVEGSESQSATTEF